MSSEVDDIKEFLDAIKRSAALARKIAYHRLQPEWIAVNSIFETMVPKVQNLLVAKAVRHAPVEYIPPKD